jgi:hypothetical protein
MQRELLRIKRSFHCEDLQSIVDMHLHAAATDEGEGGGGGGDSSTRRRHQGEVDGGGNGGRRWSSMSVPNSPRKRIKRQRAISDLSIDFFEGIPTTATTVMTNMTMTTTPSTSPSSSSSSMDDDDGCRTPKASGSSSARLITPATSHVAVASSSSHHRLDNDTTRGTRPSTTSFNFILAPRNHRGRCLRNSIYENDATSSSSSSSSSSSTSSSFLPATAALERSMLLRSCSSPLFLPCGDIDDYSPSFDDEVDVSMMDGVGVGWPSSATNAAASDNLDSPRRVEDFPWGWEGGGIAAAGGGGGTQKGMRMGSSFPSTASVGRPLVSPPPRGSVKSSSPPPSPPPYVSFAESAIQVPFLPSRETKSADGGVRQLVEALSRL